MIVRSPSPPAPALIVPLLLFALSACGPAPAPAPETEEAVTFRFAFGSCAHQDKPQPLLDVAADLAADRFIYLGDNIYGDSHSLDTLRAKYARLAAKPRFRRLRNTTPLLAVWDDHDYGWNDAGRHFPLKDSSKALFLEFWDVPPTSDRYGHPGIYGTEYVRKGGRTIQIILLDTRTFRDDLLHRPASDTLYKNDYLPNYDPDSTFLGEEQWTWLAAQLREPADARIIATSNQFSHAYNGWESWTNVPHERQRMIDLIQLTGARAVFFISGDVHWGEISRLEVPEGYPLYDVTSSGITQTWDVIEPNTNRIGPAVPQNNIGLIDLRFADTATARLALIDSSARPVVEHTVVLTDLR